MYKPSDIVIGSIAFILIIIPMLYLSISNYHGSVLGCIIAGYLIFNETLIPRNKFFRTRRVLRKSSLYYLFLCYPILLVIQNQEIFICIFNAALLLSIGMVLINQTILETMILVFGVLTYFLMQDSILHPINWHINVFIFEIICLRYAVKKLCIANNYRNQLILKDYAYHELASPLANINGIIHLLIKKYGDNSYFTNLRISVKRIQEIINIFFHIPQENKEQIEVRPEIDGIIEAFTEDGLNDIRFILHIPSATKCKINKEAFKLVVSNLIKNAIIHSKREHLKIKITFKSLVNKDILIIRDNGKGIAANKINTIFTPSYSTSGVGRGYGLSLSKYILSLYGAEIYCNSKQGKYAEFIIEFDRA
jgi:signal transduction histidine kinase